MSLKPVTNAVMDQQQYYVPPTAAGITQYQSMCGQVVNFNDLDVVAGIVIPNSQLLRDAVLVQNTSGGTLACGQALNWVSGYWKQQVQPCPNGQVARCFVPPYINGSSSNTIPNNAFFYAYYKGPSQALSDGTAIAIGDGLVIGSASGKVATYTAIGSGEVYSALAPSTAIANTTTQTAFSTQYTFAANTLKAGDAIKLRSAGIITWNSGTLQLGIYLGSTLIGQTTAQTNATGDGFFFDAEILIQTVGASGTMVANGTYIDGVIGTATEREFSLASGTALNTTIAQALTIQATWGTANAGNSVVANTFDVQRLTVKPASCGTATAAAAAGSSVLFAADVSCAF